MSVSLTSPQIAANIAALAPHLPSAELAGRHLVLTGGTGFFGRWLLAVLEYLNLQGCPVRVTLVSRNPERFLNQEPRYRHAPWLAWVRGDVRAELVMPAHFDYLLHAATDTDSAAHRDGIKIFDTVLGGTRAMLDAACRAGARRVLIVGSGAQYGRQPHPPAAFREDDPYACSSHRADSAYGEAKRAAETLAALYGQAHDMEPVFARCFAFAGPGLPIDAHFAIGNFIRDALYAPTITVRSGGEALRSYLYGADLAVWLLVLLLRGQAFAAYNVGSDEAVSIAELAGRVGRVLAPDKLVHLLGEPAVGSRSCYLPDISQARQLGLAVWTGLDEAIAQHGQWLRATASNQPQP